MATSAPARLPDPTLAQFSLTSADAARCEQRRKAIEDSLNTFIVLCAMAGGLVALTMVDSQAQTPKVIGAVISSVLVGGMCGAMLGGMAWVLFQAVANAVVRLDSRQRRFDQYQTAKRAAADAQKAWEEWDHRTRAAFWLSLKGHAFERELAVVLRRHGYHVTETRGSGDGGVDLVLKRGERTILVQCKRHSKPVGPAIVRELWGTVLHHGSQAGILAVVSGASDRAREFCVGKPLASMSVDAILALQGQTCGTGCSACERWMVLSPAPTSPGKRP